MSDFIKIAEVDAIPDPGKQVFELDDRIVVLFHVAGQFYCLDDICTHDDGPLGEGALEGTTIACPRHGAKFDIRDGSVVSMPATIATQSYETKVEGQNVLIRVED
ncbi:MAG: biphenyl 2,3-dioxygenase [Blastopirellula sp.]|nr:MAG: biphenyl 2,3-dioxygenase [Blastopirellula sp.]